MQKNLSLFISVCFIISLSCTKTSTNVNQLVDAFDNWFMIDSCHAIVYDSSKFGQIHINEYCIWSTDFRKYFSKQQNNILQKENIEYIIVGKDSTIQFITRQRGICLFREKSMVIIFNPANINSHEIIKNASKNRNQYYGKISKISSNWYKTTSIYSLVGD